jgi:hypothetical protein
VNPDAPVTLGVVDAVLAGGRRTRYELSIRTAARAEGLNLADMIILGDDDPHPLKRLIDARDHTGATVVVAPSLRHLRGTERDLTTWADIRTIGPRRIYRRGHRWA